jgi:hypothetical protein
VQLYDFVVSNRDECEARGEQVVAEMVAKFQNRVNVDPNMRS